MNVLSTLFRRSGERRVYADLLQLDDRLLRDIGVSRAELRSLMQGRANARRTAAHE